MKAMILAAGRGERMRPLTDVTPKPMLRVGGRPLIEYHIEKLAKNGFKEIVINHAWLGEQIEQLGSGERFGLTISYSPEPAGGLETAGGIINALPLLGSDPFWVINGDIWTDLDFSELTKQQLKPGQLAHLFLVSNPPHNPNGDFCLHSSGLVCSEGESRLTFSGIGLYHPALFAGLDSSARPLAPLLRAAMAKQAVTGSHFTGRWLDIGTPERLNELDQQLMENG